MSVRVQWTTNQDSHSLRPKRVAVTRADRNWLGLSRYPSCDKWELTEDQQVEANGELGVLANKGDERTFGGCLPDFVQRHEDK